MKADQVGMWYGLPLWVLAYITQWRDKMQKAIWEGSWHTSKGLWIMKVASVPVINEKLLLLWSRSILQCYDSQWSWKSSCCDVENDIYFTLQVLQIDSRLRGSWPEALCPENSIFPWQNVLSSNTEVTLHFTESLSWREETINLFERLLKNKMTNGVRASKSQYLCWFFQSFLHSFLHAPLYQSSLFFIIWSGKTSSSWKLSSPCLEEVFLFCFVFNKVFQPSLPGPVWIVIT